MSNATRISLALFAFGVIAGVILVSYLAGSRLETTARLRPLNAATSEVAPDNAATLEAAATVSGNAIDNKTTPVGGN